MDYSISVTSRSMMLSRLTSTVARWCIAVYLLYHYMASVLKESTHHC